jgi:hypothetical protein
MRPMSTTHSEDKLICYLDIGRIAGKAHLALISGHKCEVRQWQGDP